MSDKLINDFIYECQHRSGLWGKPDSVLQAGINLLETVVYPDPIEEVVDRMIDRYLICQHTLYHRYKRWKSYDDF